MAFNILWNSNEGRRGLSWWFIGKNPTKAEDRGLIPGQQDPLEKEMTTYSSILALEIPWTEEPGGL